MTTRINEAQTGVYKLHSVYRIYWFNIERVPCEVRGGQSWEETGR